MRLQGLDHTAARMSPLQSRFYYADDVDDLLARIRAAVEAERRAQDEATRWRSPVVWDRRDAAIAALDALLGQAVGNG